MTYAAFVQVIVGDSIESVRLAFRPFLPLHAAFIPHNAKIFEDHEPLGCMEDESSSVLVGVFEQEELPDTPRT